MNDPVTFPNYYFFKNGNIDFFLLFKKNSFLVILLVFQSSKFVFFRLKFVNILILVCRSNFSSLKARKVSKFWFYRSKLVSF